MAYIAIEDALGMTAEKNMMDMQPGDVPGDLGGNVAAAVIDRVYPRDDYRRRCCPVRRLVP